MSAVLTCLDLSKPHTYQHIHGTMLVNLNKIASETNLSHTEYRLMGILIGLWNKEKGIAFPTINYLSSSCRMSKSTVLRSLKRLIETNLIEIKKQKGKRNKYYLSEILFQLKKPKPGTSLVPHISTTYDTTHDNKQNRIKTKIETSKNDDLINSIKILQNWSVISPKKIILKYKLEKVLNLIEITKNNKPDNPGAYFRTLLKSFDENYHPQYKVLYNSKEAPFIAQMLKYQYWKHKPSNQCIQIKPQIGNHLLINYDKDTQFVHLIDNEAYSDYIHNFEPVENNSLEKDVQGKKNDINKMEILKQLVDTGKFDEAVQLSRIFNLKNELKLLRQC